MALGVLASILAFPLISIGYMAWVEHQRRVEVLSAGLSSSAIVTQSSDGWSSRGCSFTYRFRFGGRLYEGGEGGCSLVEGHPVGSTLSIRFDPNDPENSVAVGADLWPGWAIVPVLIAVSLLPLGGVFAYALITGAPRSRRRKVSLPKYYARSEVSARDRFPPI
ncbi:DUF3592 domain-containing protein [Sphingomonas sp. BT-65]|uniref:DUF3592 domain-containing protein n=1 Tax=Sphingomonas sp. BT-65 TaxID=2989821 RepID=UPI003557D927